MLMLVALGRFNGSGPKKWLRYCGARADEEVYVSLVLSKLIALDFHLLN
jgi:hypothetical protein